MGWLWVQEKMGRDHDVSVEELMQLKGFVLVQKRWYSEEFR